MIVGQYNFVQTCEACPEQYDVFYGVDQVGYVRIRYGVLSLYYPDVNGSMIYCFDYNDDWLGKFPTAEDRQFQFLIMTDI